MTPIESTKITLWSAGGLDAGVLALGIERGWASLHDAETYAEQRLALADGRAEIRELLDATRAEASGVIGVLWRLARLDELPSRDPEKALKRWLVAALDMIAGTCLSPDAQLDMFEVLYADLGYPTELRECSRYYVPESDVARGLRIGEMTQDPFDAMRRGRLSLAIDV